MKNLRAALYALAVLLIFSAVMLFMTRSGSSGVAVHTAANATREEILTGRDSEYTTHYEFLPDERININTASSKELERLDGIGETRAAAIIDRREKNGPYTDISELLELEEIPESVYNEIKDYITVDG